MGGLGLRSLAEMNQALVLKNIWKIASGHLAPWVLVLRAKYFPRSSFMSSNRLYNCSKLWRNLVQLKPLLYDHLGWKIGNGALIPVFSQPWFYNWRNFKALTRDQRNAMVSSLINNDTGGWEFEKLVDLFGFQQALLISLSPGSVPAPQSRPDTLLFTYAKNGAFTVSKAHQLIKGCMGSATDKKYWMAIWEAKGLLPKLKMFLWRCTKNALPVKEVLSIRIQTVDPNCQLCGVERETIKHMLFDCSYARPCRASANLGIRPDNIQGSFRQVLTLVHQQLTEEEMCLFVCAAWAVWRLRNDVVLGGKQHSLHIFNQYFAQTAEACGTLAQVLVPKRTEQPTQHGDQQSNDYACYVDGSWSEDGRAGVGLYIMHNGEPVRWVSQAVPAMNSAHAEALGVLQAFTILLQLGCQQGIIFCDSIETVDSLSHSPPVVHDWRAFDQIWSAWNIPIRMAGQCKVRHLSRDSQEIRTAHMLANQGRLNSWDREGSDIPGHNFEGLE